MQRRDLLKLSPLALASTVVGHLAYAKTPVPSEREAIFNVRTYGATGDGKTVDTPAINKAIEALAVGGGGTLLFTAGTYLCFTIRLKSNVGLYLSQGAIILAADSPKAGETTGYNGGVYDPASQSSRGRSIRTTDITTGLTRCSTARTSATSRSSVRD